MEAPADSNPVSSSLFPQFSVSFSDLLRELDGDAAFARDVPVVPSSSDFGVADAQLLGSSAAETFSPQAFQWDVQQFNDFTFQPQSTDPTVETDPNNHCDRRQQRQYLQESSCNLLSCGLVYEQKQGNNSSSSSSSAGSVIIRNLPAHGRAEREPRDGYSWRKYGQKGIKGSTYTRSYYRCVHPDCQTKKNVERTGDGQITEIVYRGNHNHEKPRQRNKTHILNQASSVSGSAPTKETERHKTSEYSGGDDEEPDAKHWKEDGDRNDDISGHSGSRTVRAPRIVVQTTSDIDVLVDGYHWRKYGQKVVKENPNPRSYFKCTATGCPVKKYVERAATDPKSVITTYEGKHTHNVPEKREGRVIGPSSSTLGGVAAAAASATVAGQPSATDVGTSACHHYTYASSDSIATNHFSLFGSATAAPAFTGGRSSSPMEVLMPHHVLAPELTGLEGMFTPKAEEQGEDVASMWSFPC